MPMNDHETVGDTLRKRLQDAYHATVPDPGNPAHAVAFGSRAIGERAGGVVHRESYHRDLQGDRRTQEDAAGDGAALSGDGTHALSLPAFRTAVEVFAANDVDVMVQEGEGFTPTPVISRAILVYNRGKKSGFADGVVVTPSHNPPEDGGFKYNPPRGGPRRRNRPRGSRTAPTN
jgi:phosphoglucomutase